jgi:hypothetical protein
MTRDDDKNEEFSPIRENSDGYKVLINEGIINTRNPLIEDEITLKTGQFH